MIDRSLEYSATKAYFYAWRYAARTHKITTYREGAMISSAHDGNYTTLESYCVLIEHFPMMMSYSKARAYRLQPKCTAADTHYRPISFTARAVEKA